MTQEHLYDAVIVGAGFGGLGQGAQLRRDGIDNFLILDKGNDIGGVWRDNTYPGAACDTQSVIYCYSYFLHTRVTRMFAGQEELLGYLRDLSTTYELGERTRLGHYVTETRWDAGTATWTIVTASGEAYRSRSFIAAWGQLSTPLVPEIPGAADYSGVTFHSSQWDHDLDLTGKRVASIGAAATAVQYVPEVAKSASHLSVFQRSANYILPRDQRIFTDAESAEFETQPDTYRHIRQEIHEMRESGFERVRKHSSASEEGMDMAREHLYAQVSDPELRAKLAPDYDYGCKRILRSDDFYPALTRDNVELITDPIDRFTPTGIHTSDSTERDFDVVIYATGFRSQAFQAGMRVVGCEGQTLDERWGVDPEAYLGMTVDGFPNMFLVYGPNTNLNHNSVVTMLEAQQAYIAQCVAYLRAGEERVLEVDGTILREFNDRVQAELEESAYASDCSSWYKNSAGRVINNWCGTVDEYRTLTQTLQLADYGIAA
ncbi:flavin-containing monooxygenase [Paeniglutamicibacter sp. MACA_103]|uniref:flavin-containing monooxygenase n=1 Tax=Paeniglutamicibacter sp. MACA_103 TaxID=3377337 RepID=UPI003894472C